jgi:MOSC domain-containing protein YiiM
MAGTMTKAGEPNRLRSGQRPQRETGENPMNGLLNCFPRTGHVVWLGVRSRRRGAIELCESVTAVADAGLVGDHYRTRSAGKRQVTLIQAEHLAVVGALLDEAPIDPARLRRNIVVSGINLLAMKDRRFRIGDAVFEGSGLAHPCSRMEEELGLGGYNALRGHGGLTARVIVGGLIRIGDAVGCLDECASSGNGQVP